MKAGWYAHCPDCDYAVFLSRWKWLAAFKFWLLSVQPLDEVPSEHDALLRCGDDPVECDLVWREGQ